MTLSADGYNTVGKLNIDFDTEKFEKDYGKQIATRFKKQMKNLKDDTYGLSSLTASLYDGYETDLFAETCATGSADKTKNLSNGDVVTYTWDDNSDEAEEAFGVKVKYTDITYTVSGLASVNTFDAFDGVDVEFSGISPDGRATVNSRRGAGPVLHPGREQRPVQRRHRDPDRPQQSRRFQRLH